jgi:hypothetical protein
VIALNIPYLTYAGNIAAYSAAFTSSVAELLNLPMEAVQTVDFQISQLAELGEGGNSYGTRIYFNLVVPGTSSSSSEIVVNTAAHVQDLFLSANIGAQGKYRTNAVFQKYFGEPFPNMIYNNYPLTAYYQDANVTVPPLILPNPSTDPTRTLAPATASVQTQGAYPPPLGEFSHSDTGEVIAMNIPYLTYAVNVAAYSAAFTASVASLLHMIPSTIQVTDFQQSANGGTKVYFNVVLSGTSTSSSEVVVQTAADIQALFQSTAVGSHANATIISSFLANGLTTGNGTPLGVYYQDY